VTLTVSPGPPAAQGGTFNIPYASVTVCNPGTSTCATIDNVLVDTGSYGLRLMASVLQASGVTLTNQPDPTTAGNTLAECQPFADGYTWGPLVTADVKIGGEAASSLSVHVIDDASYYAATAPSSCTGMGSENSLNSVVAFSANGILGIGPFDQDCGSSCSDCASAVGGCSSSNDTYYSCNTGTNTCNFTPVAQIAQIRNPVALFAADNNGVIVQLPSIPAAGQTGATGSLIFGIATQSNNGLGSATVLTADSSANITTTFNSQVLSQSFFDSGSNGLFFPDGSIPVCANTMADPEADDFYCPTSTLSLSAVNTGQNNVNSMVPFQISNLNNLNASFYASSSIGGPSSTNPSLGTYFDWGLSFFYGKSVYTAIDGKVAGSATGPYYAY
jgi:Protein of unknown function (DUF3443)